MKALVYPEGEKSLPKSSSRRSLFARASISLKNLFTRKISSRVDTAHYEIGGEPRNPLVMRDLVFELKELGISEDVI